MPKVMIVYGTRPEAIKVAPVIAALAADDAIELDVVVTGQHRAMLDQVNDLFGITPRVDLDVMTDRQSLTGLAATVMTRLGQVVADSRPDALLVQGDTTTAAVAGLVAYYAGVPVLHLEAGLRSGRLDSPFPEEGNRKLVGQLAALHFAPTPEARANLLREGVAAADVVTTGNTIIDALLHATAVAPAFDPAVQAVIDSGRRLLLVTSHRRESWEGGIAATARAIGRIVEARPDVHAVIPLHRNPIVREAFAAALGPHERVTVIDPLDYHRFSALMAASHLILTDSGGVQEEAPSLGKPVLVTRDTTERPEGVAAGAARLVGTDEQRIVDEVLVLLDEPATYAAMAQAVNPYGDGLASGRVIAAIKAFFASGARMEDFSPGPASRTAAQANSSGSPSQNSSVDGSMASLSTR